MTHTPISNVIVLIPGILGSRLRRGDEIVWGFSARLLGKVLLDRGRSLQEQLTPRQGDKIVADAILPDLHLLPTIWKIDGYSRVVQRIKADFAVQEGENFFRFPYDWRRDNRITAERLFRESRKWLCCSRRTGSDSSKLILVAHSMGGLVARYFLEVLGGWKDTRALISFGTPYRGSLNALDALVNGVRKGSFEFVRLTTLARMLPSVYQLLPFYPCYDPGDGQLVRVSEAAEFPHVDSNRVKDAADFHREIREAVERNLNDAEYLRNRYRIHPIVGVNQKTFQSARYDGAQLRMISTYNDKDLSGDGTVPRVSATPLEYSDAAMEMFTSTKHSSIQNADAVLTHLKGLISGTNLRLAQFQRTVTLGSISLEVEDIYWQSERVRLRASATQEDVELIATITDTDTGVEMGRTEMVPDSQGWHSVSFPPLPAGGYEIRVSGPSLEPVADSFAVVSERNQLGGRWTSGGGPEQSGNFQA